MPTLRIATFNVHHCRGLDGVLDVERVARVLRSLDADLIALQELDRGMRRSDGIDQPAELSRRLGTKVLFFPTLKRGEGEYGIGVVATPRVEEPAFVPLPQLADEEPRGAITGRWRGLGVVCTHLSTSARTRRVQTSALAAIATGWEAPVVVLGDLNQAQRSLGPLTSRGFRGGFGHRTLPKAAFRRQIDHILVRGLRLQRSWTVHTDASDHVPLVAEIELVPA